MHSSREPGPRAHAAALLQLAFWLFATSAGAAAPEKGAQVMHAKGTFEVKATPLSLDGPAVDPNLGRFALEKRFQGDLEATGRGQMLTVGSPTQGSAGYVAMETVSGTLHGRRGSFALQHRGVMTATSRELEVTVVPGSGTEELVGLTGRLEILIADGKHSYELTYSLPEAR